MKVLVVEDHPAVRGLIGSYLSERGFAVDDVSTAGDAMASTAVNAYDAIVLDLGLPDVDGLELLGRIGRGRAERAAIIVVSARDSLEERVRALDAGADDYLVKPFDLIELEARLRAMLRRPRVGYGPVHKRGRLVFDPMRREASVDGSAIELTRREASLLEELMRAGNRFTAKEILEERLYSSTDERSYNALEATVSRLRKKLMNVGAGVAVYGRRGVGYRLQEETRRTLIQPHDNDRGGHLKAGGPMVQRTGV
ncbi:response regulator transcription factor (plasmid) [Bradyrhizobium sp. ISRA443]|uniref:response regulator transcription factor n=1 Tax=unclassified Bradyrhizobium TaxID=2631580 RepID=UPI0024796D56|nr:MULTISPECIES: response regulator transcription factor [unclassified Bradyrhizobium]WGR90812.1 response regulator transcription factor [Bradyrhizobium sp. ISRA435]WGS03055.1 response regulator transcription factor [Bradyrhizobium sp. ISRA436]WGS09911.1 response regulator transcription factor [Bradyrhizobium sp. ISRA437]WGS16796.1 response regulator transcription factor [Bradyrhizobium sp. ISRA443]